MTGRESDGVGKRAEDIRPGAAQALQRGPHPGVGEARSAHYGPEERLGGDAGEGWRRSGGRDGPVEGAPEVWVVEVGGKGGEEACVEGDFATLEALPGAGGVAVGDAVVDPAGGDGVGVFVVEDGLEGGCDL